jgi:hypothetical protein
VSIAALVLPAVELDDDDAPPLEPSSEAIAVESPLLASLVDEEDWLDPEPS